MKSTLLLAVAGSAALVAASLGGCSRDGAATAAATPALTSNYCASFRATSASGAPAPAAPADPAASFEDCVHRWGYALAPGRDTAEVVAQAVVDACTPSLSAWNQQTMTQYQQQRQGAGPGTGEEPSSGPSSAPGEAPSALSLATGQDTDLSSERMRFAQSRALFYVVQARAAHCAPPPANTLALNAGAGV